MIPGRICRVPVRNSISQRRKIKVPLPRIKTREYVSKPLGYSNRFLVNFHLRAFFIYILYEMMHVLNRMRILMRQNIAAGEADILPNINGTVCFVLSYSAIRIFSIFFAIVIADEQCVALRIDPETF